MAETLKSTYPDLLRAYDKRSWAMTSLGYFLTAKAVSQDRKPTLNEKAGNGFGVGTLIEEGYLFLINPVKASFSKAKSRVLELTKSGYQNVYSFNRESSLDLSGTSGVFGPASGGGVFSNLSDVNSFSNLYLNPSTSGPAAGSFDITKTTAWGNFESLKAMFLLQQQEPHVLFTDDFKTFVGIVNDFNYNQDAYDPFRITWSMTFTVMMEYRIEFSSADGANIWALARSKFNDFAQDVQSKASSLFL